MSLVPDDLRYTAEHEYIRSTDVEGEFLVGITDFAQGELGDVVFLELPAAGDALTRPSAFGTIEAVKAVSSLYAPVTGEVIEVNAALSDDPALVNSDPYGAGWMIRVRATVPAELGDLLDAAAYRTLLRE